MIISAERHRRLKSRYTLSIELLSTYSTNSFIGSFTGRGVASTQASSTMDLACLEKVIAPINSWSTFWMPLRIIPSIRVVTKNVKGHCDLALRISLQTLGHISEVEVQQFSRLGHLFWNLDGYGWHRRGQFAAIECSSLHSPSLKGSFWPILSTLL